MARISILDTISTGWQTDMIGTASSPGLDPVRWGGSISWYVCILEDGSTYMKFAGGSTNTKSGLTIRTYYWPVVPVLGYSDFNVYWNSGESKWDYHVSGSSTMDFGERGTMNIDGTSASWNVSYGATFQEGNDVTHDQLIADGYKKTMNFEDWPNTNIGITMYALAAVLSNMPTTVNDNCTLTAHPLVIDANSNPKLFKYYPWERKINGEWWSLNRNGGQSTTAGLFRKVNGVWTPCTNRTVADTSQDHGFRYNNGWKKSPKSGKGA